MSALYRNFFSVLPRPSIKNIVGWLENNFCRIKLYVYHCALFKNVNVERSSARISTANSSFISLNLNFLLLKKILESSKWYMFMFFFPIDSSVEEIFWRTSSLTFVIVLFFFWNHMHFSNVFKVILDLWDYNIQKLSQISNVDCMAFDTKTYLLDNPQNCLFVVNYVG